MILSAPITCLALTMYFEARGEGIQGMTYVGEVVMARKLSEAYPDTLCEVMTQRSLSGVSQFSFYEGQENFVINEPERFDEAVDIAIDIIEHPNYGIDATHFHTTSVRPYWADKIQFVAQVGNHLFYRED